jgi:hypothetical protein
MDDIVWAIWSLVKGCLFHVLSERTSVGDIEELHTFTDTEDGLFHLSYFSHRREEILIILSARIHGSTCFLAIKCGIDIWSS